MVLLDVRHSPANISPEGVSPIFSRAHSSLGADGGSRFFVKEVPPLASDVLHLPLIKNLQQDQKPNSNCGTIKGGRNPEYRAGDGVCLGSLPLLPPQSSFTSPEVLDLKQKLFPRNRVTIALDHHSPGQEQNQILLQTDNRAVLTGSKTDRSPVFRRFLRRTSAHSYPQTKRKTRTGSPGPHGDRDSNPGPTKKCFLKKKADVDVSAQKVHLGQGPTGPPSGADQTRSRPGRPESNHDQSPGACPECPKTQCLTSRGRQSPGRNARSKFGENSFFPAPPVPPFPTPLLDSSFSLKLKYSHSTRSPGCNSSSSPFSSSIAKHNVLIFVEDLVPVRPYSDDLHGKDLREEEGVGRGERYDCPGRTEEGPEGEADDSIEEKTPGRDQTSRRSRDSTPCTPPGKQTTDRSSSTRTSEGRTNRDMAVQTQGFTNQDPNWSPPTVWSYLSYLSQGAAEPLSAEKVEGENQVTHRDHSHREQIS